VFIADSHACVAEGIGVLLEWQPDIQVGRMATSAGAAIAHIIRHRPRVAVLDHCLDDGIDAAQEITTRWAGTRCVLTSSEVTRALISAAFNAGCRSVVPKQANAEVLLNAVRAAARGETYVPSGLKELLEEPEERPPRPGALSRRQRQILQLVAVGASVEQIGEQLHLSSHTVRNHLRHAMAKLKARTRLATVVTAARAGFITVRTPIDRPSLQPHRAAEGTRAGSSKA
jgi:DNA-binding NarL/FixJ family response regulator